MFNNEIDHDTPIANQELENNPANEAVVNADSESGQEHENNQADEIAVDIDTEESLDNEETTLKIDPEATKEQNISYIKRQIKRDEIERSNSALFISALSLVPFFMSAICFITVQLHESNDPKEKERTEDAALYFFIGGFSILALASASYLLMSKKISDLKNDLELEEARITCSQGTKSAKQPSTSLSSTSTKRKEPSQDIQIK